MRRSRGSQQTILRIAFITFLRQDRLCEFVSISEEENGGTFKSPDIVLLKAVPHAVLGFLILLAP